MLIILCPKPPTRGPEVAKTSVQPCRATNSISSLLFYKAKFSIEPVNLWAWIIPKTLYWNNPMGLFSSAAADFTTLSPSYISFMEALCLSKVSFVWLIKVSIVSISSLHVIRNDLNRFQDDLVSNHFHYCIAKVEISEPKERKTYNWTKAEFFGLSIVSLKNRRNILQSNMYSGSMALEYHICHRAWKPQNEAQDVIAKQNRIR